MKESNIEIKIPRTTDDNADYYLVEIEFVDGFFETTHKRVSSKSIGFSRTRIDCSKMLYKDLAYGEDKIENMKYYIEDMNWTILIGGSSKSDLVHFVREKYFLNA